MSECPLADNVDGSCEVRSLYGLKQWPAIIASSALNGHGLEKRTLPPHLFFS